MNKRKISNNKHKTKQNESLLKVCYMDIPHMPDASTMSLMRAACVVYV